MKYFRTIQLPVKLTKLRQWPAFLCMLVCSLTVFPPFAYSDDEVFCFTDLGGGVCEGNEKHKSDFLGKFEIEKGSDPILINFKFRAYDGDDSEEWKLKRESLYYYSPSSGYSKVDETFYNIEMSSPRTRPQWATGDSISGGDDDGKPDTYYTTNLHLTFHDNYINKLEAGEHAFWLWIKGRADDEEYNNFYIEIGVIIRPKVKISGLENASFGTFLADGFNRSHYQTFCAHVQGGGDFKITPTTQNEVFELKGKNTGDFIDYSVYLANVGSSIRQIRYGDTRHGLSGDVTENCTTGTGENMQLKIELPEISILSVKPADIYMDTLTLTIEAD
ncbi:hypothetical protein [Endozoicomonas lisbonensis]|uniref:Spore coat protein U domain-containing protein n=1 Tax=Endozoicomonas lisbonensis TaxID=3120522 RepID=A0ABV2SG73_9GAMM